jgi:iron-sulfur cluster repair protein YtfE (RIC family)
VLQEVIDVLAIAIALRALLPSRTHSIRLSPSDVAVARRLKDEHDATRDVVELIRSVADQLTSPGDDLAPVRHLHERLRRELLPHEKAEEELLVPLVARALGSSAATAALSRTHAEIEHQVERLGRLLAELDEEITPEDMVELRRLLYGLYGILRLHNAQEEEGAFSLMPPPTDPSTPRG